MIRIRVKIESNGNTYNFRFEKEEDYNVSKENLDLQNLVRQCVDGLNLKEKPDIKVFATFEW